MYPRSSIKKKDFVVRASDLLYMSRSSVEEFRTVTKAMSMLGVEPEDPTGIKAQEPRDLPEPVVSIPETSFEDEEINSAEGK